MTLLKNLFSGASARRSGESIHPRPGRALADARTKILPAVTAACSLLLGAAAFAGEYHSNDLTPAGSTSGKLTGVSGGRQVGAATINNGSSHAVLLSGNALAVTDLHPANYYYSMANCADDTQQGGWAYGVTGGMHAMVWNGSSTAYADLNPSGYMFSACLGVHSGEQCGYAQNQSYFVTASHAMSWHGSAASCVDLHPVGIYPFSRATGCRDGEEVGYVSSLAYPDGDVAGYHSTSRAVRWNGTAASAVDLHPIGYDASEATCTSGTQQGGWGYNTLPTPNQHALIWSGEAASAVDLHPAGYTDSKVTAISGTNQVGEGWVGPAYGYASVRHALLWSGTPDSVVDLNQYLPAGYTNAVATGIDANGNVVGFAYNGSVYYTTLPANGIAVVFAPGAPAPTQLASITLAPANVAPADPVQVSIALGGPAPAGGVHLDFLSTATTLLATPASLDIPEGESNAVFSVTADGAALTVPASLKLYATDGSVSRASTLTLTPVVKLASLTANAVEGGFSTYGSVSLNIPAQFGGSFVSLASGDASLLAVPAALTIPQGYSSWSFTLNTAPVTALTSVPVTATCNGQTVTGSVLLSPAPIVSLSGLSAPEVVGGQSVPLTISLNNFPRSAAGADITLSSGDTGTLQLPASVNVPYGTYGITLSGTSTVVSGRKGVSVKATYNGSTVTTTVFVNPIPTVVITQADYMLDTKMLKVQATTTFTNSILTYGGDPANGPFGTMQFEQGVFKGSIVLEAAPSAATVWSSVGGQASMKVTIRTGAGSGGGGGGTTTTTPSGSYKLTLKTTGKGTVTTSPSGTSFAAGTVVTLAATPAAGSPWIGWSGDAAGTARTIAVTISKAMTIQANFK